MWKRSLPFSINFLLDFTAHTRSIFKLFMSMYLRNGSFLKPFNKLAVRVLSGIKHNFVGHLVERNWIHIVKHPSCVRNLVENFKIIHVVCFVQRLSSFDLHIRTQENRNICVLTGNFCLGLYVYNSMQYAWLFMYLVFTRALNISGKLQ